MEASIAQKNFEKVMEKALKDGKYDYFGIADIKTAATINSSEVSRIKNAIIFLTDSDLTQKWEVRNYQVQQCPKELHICIKNPKVVLGCVGDHEVEESYFELKDKPDYDSSKYQMFIGIVEVYECACAFYFAPKYEKQFVLYSFTEQKDNSLYDLISCLLKVQEDLYEVPTQDITHGMWETNDKSTELWDK